MSRRHNISIDRVVGAPRYRKYNVDERNATDKRFLKFKIFLIGTPEIVTRKRRMEAAAMIEGGELSDFVEKRYAGWKEELGQSILNCEQSLESLSALVHGQNINPEQVSGRQELLENIVNRYV